jgi:HSP20 family protein
MLLQELSRSRFLDTFRDWERKQALLNRMFHAPAYGGALEVPALNIWTSQDSAVVTAEIPGLAPEDVDISVLNETLSLRGSRQEETLEEDAKWHRRERAFGEFARTIQLPFRIDADKVEATFANGVLEIKLPRSEQDKPRKITVNAG